MKAPQAPRIDPRRRKDFSAELRERARAWIPAWAFADVERDFGGALLEIAARFNSEVAERLDNAGEKMRRGFLDWLGVRGEAARPARMPVVMKLADNAPGGVLASAPVRLQAEADEAQVIFETESDLFVVPGQLDVLIGVDADADAFYQPPPGLSDLAPLEPLPAQWQLKSFAALGATTIQLDPDVGIQDEMIIEAGGKHYRITKNDNGIVAIEPSLESDLQEKTIVRKVVTFAPFDGATRNRQEHALYIGDAELLNIDSAATISVVGAETLRTGITWQYWGKVKDVEEEPSWQPLTLATTQKSDALVLEKPEGAIDMRSIGEVNSRWIRGTTNNIEDPKYSFSVDALKLKINCPADPVCPRSGTIVKGTEAEAMTNNTPLVLSEPFFPLGQVPRQFDAFYLGSTESFSKKGAIAQLCFEISDATSSGYVPVRKGSFAKLGTVAAVGKDRALHLLKLKSSNGTMTTFRGPLRPPKPPEPNTQPPENMAAELNARCLPVIWNDPAKENDFYVAVAAGGSIWIWHENSDDEKKSGWSFHSKVPDTPGQPAQIESMIVLKRALTRPGALLSNGRYWIFNGTEWVEPLEGTSPAKPFRDYAVAAPILDGTLEPTDFVIAVSMGGKLYRLDTTPNGTQTEIKTSIPLDTGDASIPSTVPVGGIQPAAIDDGQLQVVAVGSGRDRLVAVLGAVEEIVELDANVKAIGSRVTIAEAGAPRQYSVSAQEDVEDVVIASWVPTRDAKTVFYSRIPDASGKVGSPLVQGFFMVVPGARGDTFVAPYDPSGRLDFTDPTKLKRMREGLIVPQPAPFGVNDFLSAIPADTSLARRGWKIEKRAALRGTTDAIYIVDPDVGESLSDNPQVIGYKASADEGGHKKGSHKFQQNNVEMIPPGSVLRIHVTGEAVTFAEVEDVSSSGLVTLRDSIPGSNGDTLQYWKPNPMPATVVPALEFDPSGDGRWDVTILETARLYFPKLEPRIQQGSAFGVVGTHPSIVALGQRWTGSIQPLNQPTAFLIDAEIGVWRQQLADTRSNPALSWEYWNGKGWWSLEIVEDGTERLATSGPVSFKVPKDIAESDWAGKTNFWIRARLVGGDYGQEEVKVVNRKNEVTNEMEQIVVRSTDNIRAPQVLDLQVTYSMCKDLLPTYVLAQDSGSIVDQSDANRTGGAIVEAFIPLAQALGRLSTAAAPTKTEEECPPNCECEGSGVAKMTATAILDAAARAPVTPATGRSLFIGLKATLADGPVNVLLLAEKESDHTAFAPMTIDALSAERHFKPIVADDTTRALGESGILSMSFAVPPTVSELFGATQTWLRLTPKKALGEWTPSVCGAYLNAVYATAKETLTREAVGSSNGSPKLRLFLARPPVLRNTLELRVLEPLGEEEREELVNDDPKSVVSDLEELPGDWVLWEEVLDPDDAGPFDRVYSLDDETGEIRFGDGVHGCIPPIGRDSIVAFGYSRTEGSSPGSETVPGNSIKARTPLNLVTPVESVESVTAADQAAGGAPPETDERVLRFGFARLRHRGRAVTAKDIEDLAMQSSPDIAQAKVTVKQGYVRLVVVMKGKDPTPNAAQKRELRRVLLEVSSVSLSPTSVFRINGPGIRKLRVELRLDIARLDDAGEVSKWVKANLKRFFDSTIGGVDGTGWLMGEVPTEDDIAFILSGAPKLEGIVDIRLYESIGNGVERPLPESVKPTEILLLDDDPVRIQFQTSEVTV